MYTLISTNLCNNVNFLIFFQQDDINIKNGYDYYISGDMFDERFKQLCSACWIVYMYGFVVINVSELEKKHTERDLTFLYHTCALTWVVLDSRITTFSCSNVYGEQIHETKHVLNQITEATNVVQQKYPMNQLGREK